MAGIIAGRDAGANPASPASAQFLGMAPDARIVSVKVADAYGATDVSQVIAGIDWVVQHQERPGTEHPRAQPLAGHAPRRSPTSSTRWRYAAEQAWLRGIVVVVAAGNDGTGTGRLLNPAQRPVRHRRRGRELQRHDHRRATTRSRRSPPAATACATPTSWPRAPRCSRCGCPAATSTRSTARRPARRPVLPGQRHEPGRRRRLRRRRAAAPAAPLADARTRSRRCCAARRTALPAADPQAQGNGLLALREPAGSTELAVRQALQTFPRSTGTGLAGRRPRRLPAGPRRGGAERRDRHLGQAVRRRRARHGGGRGAAWTGGTLERLRVDRRALARAGLAPADWTGTDLDRPDLGGPHLGRRHLGRPHLGRAPLERPGSTAGHARRTWAGRTWASGARWAGGGWG